MEPWETEPKFEARSTDHLVVLTMLHFILMFFKLKWPRISLCHLSFFCKGWDNIYYKWVGNLYNLFLITNTKNYQNYMYYIYHIYYIYCKEIQPVNPKGNQSWIFIGRTDAEAETPILCPCDVKNWVTGKDPDAG